MYYNVYIDIVFWTNLLMDYILLRIVGKLFLRKRSRLRILLAAAFGALFSCLILYVPSDGIFSGKILLHGGCALLMLILGAVLGEWLRGRYGISEIYTALIAIGSAAMGYGILRLLNPVFSRKGRFSPEIRDIIRDEL